MTDQGQPIPYIAERDDLGQVNAARRALCLLVKLCQLCGDSLGHTAVVAWWPSSEVVMDGALHPSCWKIARAHCPVLSAKAGTYRVAEVLTSDLQEHLVGDDPVPAGFKVPA